MKQHKSNDDKETLGDAGPDETAAGSASTPKELIAYLYYALDDIRPLSGVATVLLANAITALARDTGSNPEEVRRMVSADLSAERLASPRADA